MTIMFLKICAPQLPVPAVCADTQASMAANLASTQSLVAKQHARLAALQTELEAQSRDETTLQVDT